MPTLARLAVLVGFFFDGRVEAELGERCRSTYAGCLPAFTTTIPTCERRLNTPSGAWDVVDFYHVCATGLLVTSNGGTPGTPIGCRRSPEGNASPLEVWLIFVLFIPPLGGAHMGKRQRLYYIRTVRNISAQMRSSKEATESPCFWPESFGASGPFRTCRMEYSFCYRVKLIP